MPLRLPPEFYPGPSPNALTSLNPSLLRNMSTQWFVSSLSYCTSRQLIYSPAHPTADDVDAYLAPKRPHPSFGADPALSSFQTKARARVFLIESPSLPSSKASSSATAFISKALPEHGQINTLELHPHHAAVERQNFAKAGLVPFPTVHVGPALETLEKLQQPDEEGLLKKGGVIVVNNNAVREDMIALSRGEERSPIIEGMRRLYDWIEQDAGRTVLADVTQTVGERSWE
ncbi:hypothetical protein IAR50_001624 [Cryptococcus sp. DSM 104548]